MHEAIGDPFMYIQEGFIPSKDNVILDIGAQYGDYAMIWEKKYNCRVFSFEIAPENFAYLQENILINRSSVRGYNIAIGNGEEINFDFKESMSHKSNGGGGGETFKTISLDDWIHDNNVMPDILKIDVEGAEYEVLQGAKQTITSLRPKIILETHSKALREKCDQFMKTCGYKLSIEGRTSYNASEVFDEVTNLFYLTD